MEIQIQALKRTMAKTALDNISLAIGNGMYGLLGRNGAGKTTLLKAVGNLAGGVIDCDEVYHEMLEYDSLLPEQLERTFGPLRDSSGKIDRKKLGRIVFGHPDKLEQLNAIEQGKANAISGAVQGVTNAVSQMPF